MKKLQLFIENHVKNVIREFEQDNDDENVSKGIYDKVVQMLNDPRTNEAEVMRQLWNPPVEDEDAKRSLFTKKKNGELNDDGVPYSFDDKEIQKLNSILSKNLGA